MRAALLCALLSGACSDDAAIGDAGPADARWVERCAVPCDPGVCPPNALCRGDGFCHNLPDDPLCAESDGLARCGDGIFRPYVEECDDGNAVADDACTPSCLECVGGDARAGASTGVCYERHDAEAAWAQANSACINRGGGLAELFTAEELAAAADLVGATPVIIGVDYQGNYGWSGSSGYPPPIAPWAPGEPACGGGSCDDWVVLLGSDGLWTTASSQTPAPYLCERRSPWRIRPDDRHAYRLIESTAHDVAQAACVTRYGGHLATINSAEEQAFLQTIASHFWAGGSDLASEGTWTWVTGEPFTFLNWRNPEPDGSTGANCLEVWSSYDWQWIDGPCSESQSGLCEVE